MQINFNKLLNTRYALKAYLRGYKNNNQILDLDDTFALFLDSIDLEDDSLMVKNSPGCCYTSISKKSKVLSSDFNSLKWNIVEDRVFKDQSLIDSKFLDAFHNDNGYSFFYKNHDEENTKIFEEDIFDTNITNSLLDIDDKFLFYRNYVWNNLLSKKDEQLSTAFFYAFIKNYLQRSSSNLANKLYFMDLHEKKNLIFFRPQTVVLSSSLVPTLDVIVGSSSEFSSFEKQKLENALDFKLKTGALIDVLMASRLSLKNSSEDSEKINSLLIALKKNSYVSNKVIIAFLKLVLLNSPFSNKKFLNLVVSGLIGFKKDAVKKPTAQTLLGFIKVLNHKKKYK